MEKMYNEVIRTLMENDHNGTWNEILDESEGNVECATTIVIVALERIIDEDGLQGEELQFYKDQLLKMESI
jgi:hypothetical protein